MKSPGLHRAAAFTVRGLTQIQLSELTGIPQLKRPSIERHECCPCGGLGKRETWHWMYFMTSQDKPPKELCRMKKAVRSLIRQNPDGMTHSDICTMLKHQSLFLGTYRNLLSQTSAVLRLLVEEGTLLYKGEGASKTFLYVGNRSLH
jgi:hypothetical protein